MAVTNSLDPVVCLGVDAASHVFSHSTLQMLGRANSVCTQWRLVTDHDSIWKEVLQNIWNRATWDPSAQPSIDFTEFTRDYPQFKYRTYFKNGANLSVLDRCIAARNCFNSLKSTGICPDKLTVIQLVRDISLVKGIGFFASNDFFPSSQYNPNCQPKKLLVITPSESSPEQKRVIQALCDWVLIKSSKDPSLRWYPASYRRELFLERISQVVDPKGRVQLDKLAVCVAIGPSVCRLAGPRTFTVIKLLAQTQISFPKGTSKDSQGAIDVEVLEKASRAFENQQRNPTIASYARQVVSYTSMFDLLGAGIFYWSITSAPSNTIFYVMSVVAFIVGGCLVLYTAIKFPSCIYDDYRQYQQYHRVRQSRQ
jgi:hypothetical protein